MKLGKRGFTLVELLVVIGICGLLLAVTYPSFYKLRQTVLVEGKAQALAADLRRAEIEALTRLRTIERLPFKFASSGFPLPGYSGTLVLSPRRKVIVSSVGRVRLE
jgi:prepilin-type N-terminal cleavage/methylation domain-containing protein